MDATELTKSPRTISRKKLIISALCGVAIVGGCFGPSIYRNTQFDSDLKDYVNKELIPHSQHVTSFSLGGEKDNKLTLIMDDSFESLNLGDKQNLLYQIMKPFDDKRFSLLSQYDLYPKDAGLEILPNIVAAIPKGYYELSSVGTLRDLEGHLHNYTTTSYSGSQIKKDSDQKGSYTSSTWNKTAGNTDGNDWLRMNQSQKRDIVGGVLMDWKKEFQVNADEQYFISALDAFYGDKATNSTNLAQAMSLIGTSGNVLLKK
jgi:hypothetical protein